MFKFWESKTMTDIISNKPSYIFGYWRPWNENSDMVNSYLDYINDISLINYQSNCVGQYISQASSEQIQAIGALGEKMGLISKNQNQAIEDLHEKVNKIGDTLGLGLAVLSQKMSAINNGLSFINKNLEVQIEQQKLSNLILQNIVELLRVPDSEKERQRCIELGLKFFVSAKNDSDLFDDALTELLKAEELMKQDYFVLHRIGLIYLYSKSHLNPNKALDYFSRAAKYASIDSDPKAVKLVNALIKSGNFNSSNISNEVKDIAYIASESYEKAAFASYILGNFESSVNLQSKAVKLRGSCENYFMLAKYQARIKQIDLCVNNLSTSLDKTPEIITAIFKDIDLINEPEVLKVIDHYIILNQEKDKVLNSEIQSLINQFENNNSTLVKEVIKTLQKFLNQSYSPKKAQYNYAKVLDMQNWSKNNLDISTFRNGDTIPEVKRNEEWLEAGTENRPAWCYFENNPSDGNRNGKMYNWYAVNDPRGLAPDGWHIPSINEWNLLEESLGDKYEAAKKLKSLKEWGKYPGNNLSGFNALPTGSRFTGSIEEDPEFENGIFFSSKYTKDTTWWSSSEKDKNCAFIFGIDGDKTETEESFGSKGSGYYIRLVRD